MNGSSNDKLGRKYVLHKFLKHLAYVHDTMQEIFLQTASDGEAPNWVFDVVAELNSRAHFVPQAPTWIVKLSIVNEVSRKYLHEHDTRSLA